MDTLSRTMKNALAVARQHDDRLVRLPGGFWTYEGCERSVNNGYPTWSVGTSTVNSLVKRGLMTYIGFKERDDGTAFPICASVNAT
jgi:hypothetical protein